MNRMTLSGRFFYWLLFTTMIPLLLLAGFYLLVFKDSFLQQERDHLSQIADQKVAQIEAFINEGLTDIHFLSQTLASSNTLNELKPLYKKFGGHSEKYLLRKESYHQYFHSFQKRGYYDIFFITPDGEIIFSLEHESDYATNIFTGPYRNSGLSQVAQSAKLTLESTSSSFSFYSPSNEAAAFMAAPVFHKGYFIGIVALQVDFSIIQKISQEVAGSKQSREVVIASRQGDDFSYQMPVKFDSNIKVGKHVAIEDLSTPLFNAVEGVRKTSQSKDYRGVDVIAASRYIPSMNWGLVLKENVSEVMQVVDEMIRAGMIILAVFLLSVIVIAGYLGRWVARPFVSMTRVTQAIADGDTALKVVPEGFVESYELAESFNKMSEHLNKARNTLEETVDERTREFLEERIKLNQAQNIAHIGNWELDPVENTLWWSDEVYRIFGMDPLKFDASYESFIDAIHPDDRERVDKAYTDSIKNKLPYSIKHRLLLSDGTIKYVQEHCESYYDDKGNAKRSLGTVQDITAYHQAEEALVRSAKEWNYAMDFFEDAIYLIDLDDKLVRANRAFYEMTESIPEQVIGKDIVSIIHPQGEEIPCPVCKARRERRDEVIVMEVDHPDNPAGRPIQVTVRVIHDSNDVPEGVLIGVRDLSQVRENEKENMRLQDQLHQSQKMDALGKLTGGIAHDYNNMLGVILGYAELLETQLEKQPKLAKYVHEIHHAGKRGVKLTNKLLSFSRKKVPEADKLDLNALLQNEQHMLEKTLTVRIQLILDLQDNLWPVWLDDSDMEDAILNMSINAMHAMEGNGQLTIQTRNLVLNKEDAQALTLTPGDYVLLSITDTGCGMDEEMKEKIFEPFFSTKAEEGTGLGLSQVYGFVKRSSGSIIVSSEPDHGSRFSLYFPRCMKSDSDEELYEDILAPDIRGNATILVVDDEQSLRDVTCELLRQHGFTAISAKSAKEALQLLEHEAVDLLISDIIMPDMDGYQLASIVKEKYPSIIIQLVSGFTFDRDVNKGNEDLKQNLLLKPFNSQELLKRIQGLLEKK